MEFDTDQAIDQAILFYSYEALSIRTLVKHLKPRDVFIDIGTNVGYYSLLARKHIGDNGRVIGFEANPAMAIKAARNFELNNATVELHNVALSDTPGTVQLYCPPDHTGEASLKNQGWNNADVFDVPARRLDDVIEGIDRVDFVKADIEGAELLAFRGAERSITKHGPAILMEINSSAARAFGYETFAAAELLMAYRPDFQIHAIDTHRLFSVTIAELKDRRADKVNLLFSRKDKKFP